VFYILIKYLFGCNKNYKGSIYSNSAATTRNVGAVARKTGRWKRQSNMSGRINGHCTVKKSVAKFSKPHIDQRVLDVMRKPLYGSRSRPCVKTAQRVLDFVRRPFNGVRPGSKTAQRTRYEDCSMGNRLRLKTVNESLAQIEMQTKKVALPRSLPLPKT